MSDWDSEDEQQPLHDEIERLRAELAAARELLREWDALINYQYSGSREAMSALIDISQKTARALYGEPPWPSRIDAALAKRGE